MRTLRSLCGPFFIFAGALHFISPRFYLQIMPRWLPWHQQLVAASGVAEIAGGALLMAPPGDARRAGGWLTIATLLGVFPANVDMALNADRFHQVPGAPASLWARLPVQGLFLAWARAAMTR